jgi:hypothetical protein
MWATPDESGEYIATTYRQACAHADETIAALDLDAPGHVPHWAEGHQDTTLGVLLIRMLAETSQHAGHADIVREQLDGQTTTVAHDNQAEVQAAADHFR